MTDEYRIQENEQTKEEERDTRPIEEQSAELMEEFKDVRRKVLSGKDDMEDRKMIEAILDGIEDLLVKEISILKELDDPEVGKWIYDGDDDELRVFTFRVLALELILCNMLAEFDRMSDKLAEPFKSTNAKLAINIGCITLRTAIEHMHLTIHAAYRNECKKAMGEEDEQEE